MFYFEQLLKTALNGIDSTNIMTTVLKVAGTILLLSFLYGAYQAFSSGGDVRMLAIAGVKYLILGLVFLKYGTIFRDVNAMFNSVADFIYTSSGVGDLFNNWLGQLQKYWQANGSTTLWTLVTNLIPGLVSVVLILVAFIVYPFAYLLFLVFYVLYGSALYVVGPFVLALLPARGVGQLARTYLVNLMIFQSWGLIYAIIQVLMSAVNLGSISAVFGQGSILGSFYGSGQMMLLALTSILFSVSIALIPFIASRIVRGDVGSTMLAVVGAATTAASMAASLAAKTLIGGGEGFTASQPHGGAPSARPAPPPVGAQSSSFESGGLESRSLGPSRPPSLPPTEPESASFASASGGTESSSFGSAVGGSGTSPSSRATRQPSGRPGEYHGFSYAHATAWYTGYALGKGVRALGWRK